MSKSQSDHPGEITSIGVVGAGTMGTGIAYVAALAGCAVFVVESTPAATQKMWAALADAVESGVKKGRITGSDSSLLVSRVSALTHIDELPASLDIVIETVPEDLPLKIDVLTQIERRSPKVIASNTSALSIDELGSSINEPGRFLGMHFFNPVWSIKLIELVIGKGTGQAAVDTAIQFSRQTGKEHLLVKDHTGFATSRLDLIASLEAIRMLEAGVASLHRARGAALVDMNADGLLDLAVLNRRAPLELYQNVTEGGGNWLSVSVHQDGVNPDAVGAFVELRAGDRVWTQEITVGGGHAGGSAGPLHFGLGPMEQAELRVIWPDGMAGGWQPVELNQAIAVTR